MIDPKTFIGFRTVEKPRMCSFKKAIAGQHVSLAILTDILVIQLVGTIRPERHWCRRLVRHRRGDSNYARSEASSQLFKVVQDNGEEGECRTFSSWLSFGFFQLKTIDFCFPKRRWNHISDDAKDFIKKVPTI